MKLYCQDCGAVNEYSGVKPNFCGSCGTPFTLDAAKAKLKKQKKPRIDSHDEDEEEVTRVPDLEGLKYEILHKPIARRQRLTDIAATSPRNMLSPPREKRYKRKPSRKKILSDFSSEAGARKSARPKSIEIS